ncbi:TrbI/VirB10 family protein [Pinisolibacter aquiterrae]|uniref:TrbI/VirB10 family protein n=1 Tax=Pinisolibacter aquiterrae TaxID=2815579 RepID=UPI001C3D2FA3|nr:TrbI/VirB10 family protein [Pinisolibacter aquiterrae]MBV5265081.1 TrbI/VirB10 family protein [Pinisolibacter aquiterrae]MCC8237099.1 TrbI/VirB10 family protein [Pinisolibacter aquiterrae]
MTGSNDKGRGGIVTPDLRLRGERPRVTRLSRKVLIGLGGISALAIAGALVYALQSRSGRSGGEELYATGNHAPADGLATLPKDYAGIPKLGPALPGDLGRPILEAQGRGQPLPNPMPVPGISQDEQRRTQESEAARISRLFTQTETRNVMREPAAGSASTGPTGEVKPVTPDLAALGLAPQPATPSAADRQLAFVNGTVDRRTVSADRLASAASPYVVQAGTVIPAALITGIRSDLPGQITAQVSENVHDTPTGRFLLIPQGSRLVGQYDSQVAFGQSRVLLVWTRLLLPDGQSIVLERQQGADAAGLSGLQDEVDYHWWDLAKAAALSTLLGVGTQLGSSGTESDLVRAVRNGAADSINNTGQQVVQRQLNIQPTLTIRPGFPVRVIVNRDLVLAPYGGQTP